MYNHKKSIHIDAKQKSELASHLSEPARSIFREEPSDMEIDQFITFISWIERIAKKSKEKLREEGSNPVDIFPLVLIALFSSIVLFALERGFVLAEWVLVVIFLVCLVMAYLLRLEEVKK